MANLKIIPYPKFDNKEFYKKIYKKKEFHDTKGKPPADPANHSEETIAKLYPKNKNFKLLSSQKFVRNYISESTPYRSLYIFHGTGVGKTCSAIVIAERFRKRVETTGKKILIVVEKSIKGEFYKTIFNLPKELLKKSKRLVVQCTGKTYQLGKETKYMSTNDKKKIVKRMIENNYEVIGRQALTNYVMRETEWDGKKENLNERIEDKMKELFSNRVIIIDEAHSNTTAAFAEDKFYPIMTIVISVAKNIRLILMSATPMNNDSIDIYPQLKLLRLNAGLEMPKKADLFKKVGDKNYSKLTENGKKRIRELLKGMVSYVRGDDPPRFPYKLEVAEAVLPKCIYDFSGEKIPERFRVKHVKIIECYSSSYQYKTYKGLLKKKEYGGLRSSESQSSNIIFPLLNIDKFGAFGDDGYSTIKDEAAILQKTSGGKITYGYNNFSEGFLLKENIEKYSTKFYKIYNNLILSKGISFVYSKWISGGVRTFALMLEQNGFEPAANESSLLVTSIKRPLICYKCGKPRHSDTDHKWASAKYILFTGDTSTDISKITDLINRDENRDGELVKVILGSSVSGEGVDFRRIRQVHVMEPWYNLARIDQVIGRAARNKSHLDLPPAERNVDIFRYCMVSPKSSDTKTKKTESIDEYLYRLGEDKDKFIKEIERIMKEMAVDCIFQKENNIRTVKRKIILENSFGKKIKYTTGDDNYSRACDYDKCTYNCDWEPKSAKIIIDKSTYSKEFIIDDIEKIREEIYNYYKKNFVLNIDTITSKINEKYPNIDVLYVYLTLDNFLDKDNNYLLHDKYGREGYLIEKDKFYIFQPYELKHEKTPIIYKKIPLKTKVLNIPFDSITMKYEKKIIKEKDHGLNVLKKLYEKYNFIKQRIDRYIVKVDKYIDIINDMIFSKISDKDTIELLKEILTNKNHEKQMNDFIQIILKYYKDNKNIYEYKDRIAIKSGNHCSQYGRSQEKGLKKKGEWGMCDVNIKNEMASYVKSLNYNILWDKIPDKDKIREDEEYSYRTYLDILTKNNLRSDYLGSIETTGSTDDKTKHFKIWNFINYVDIGSKRSERRGITCKTVKSPVLYKMYDVLKEELRKLNFKDLKEITKKIKINNLCTLIEFTLRYLEKNTKKVWFINVSDFSDIT